MNDGQILAVVDDDKLQYQHVEEITPELTQKPQLAGVPLKSSLDHLPVLKAIWVFRRVVLLCSLAAFSASLDGYQFQMSGSIVANKGLIKTFSHGGKALQANWVSTFSGIFSAGQVIGQLCVPWVADRIGRILALYVVYFVLGVAIILEAISKEWYVWAVAKLVAGVGIGALVATLPIYINEHSPAQIRGFLVVGYSLWWNFGGLLASIILNYQNLHDPLNFRTPVLTQIAFLGTAVILFLFLPETPWWLARKGKIEKARKVLQRSYKNVEGFDVDTELNVILATIENQREFDREVHAAGPFAMFKGLNLKRFFIASWPKVLQQFVGLAVFSQNASYFFQIAGFANPFQVTVILASVTIAGVIGDAIFVDKLGRRKMTMIGFTGVCIGMTLIAIVSCLDYTKPALGALLVLGGSMASFFNAFQSSTSYAYLTEVPELRFKAQSGGFGLAWNNMWGVLINFTLPLMLKAWSIRAAFFFVCTGIPGTVLAYFILPETMGRSPAEIQEMFVDGVPLRKWKGHKTEVELQLEALEQRNGQHA